MCAGGGARQNDPRWKCRAIGARRLTRIAPDSPPRAILETTGLMHAKSASIRNGKLVLCFSKLLERFPMPKMSIDALLKLRDEVGKVLTNKTNELKHQIARLEGETGYGNRGRHSSLKGRKVAVKYRDGSANAWA